MIYLPPSGGFLCLEEIMHTDIMDDAAEREQQMIEVTRQIGPSPA